MQMVDRLIAWENGEMDHHEMIELFQDLVNSGLAWQLQGSYGRVAAQLIRNGSITDPNAEQE